MKKTANIALITVSIFLGLLVIVGFALIIRKEEVVNLPIKLVEFADYECPACGYYHPAIKKVLDSYTDNLLVYEFKHLPLESIHPNAYNAALAAEAAGLQGKFDEYADRLFFENLYGNDNVNYLNQDNLEKYAGELGLDLAKFKIDMQSNTVKQNVDNDIAEAEQLGISGTPTFYINDRLYVLPTGSINGATISEQQQQIADEFIKYIDSKIEKAVNK